MGQVSIKRPAAKEVPPTYEGTAYDKIRLGGQIPFGYRSNPAYEYITTSGIGIAADFMDVHLREYNPDGNEQPTIELMKTYRVAKGGSLAYLGNFALSLQENGVIKILSYYGATGTFEVIVAIKLAV